MAENVCPKCGAKRNSDVTRWDCGARAYKNGKIYYPIACLRRQLTQKQAKLDEANAATTKAQAEAAAMLYAITEWEMSRPGAVRRLKALLVPPSRESAAEDWFDRLAKAERIVTVLHETLTYFGAHIAPDADIIEVFKAQRQHHEDSHIRITADLATLGMPEPIRGKLANSIAELVNRTAKAEQERDEYRAVVEKLPKTKDGVTVMTGDVVWLPDLGWCCVSKEWTCERIDPQNVGLCYSTEAAARAKETK